MKSYKVFGFVAAVLFYLSGAAQAESLILNGDFETYTKEGNATTSIANWTFPVNWSGVTTTDGAPDSPSGYMGTGNAFFGQTTDHNIVAGEVYNVSYWAALSYDDGYGGSTRVALAYDNEGTLTEIAGASQSLTLTTFQDWQSYDFSFTAQDGQDYTGKAIGIKLVNTHSSGWVGFDTVAVNTIPEPGTLLLLTVGLLGMLAYAWRKR